MKTTSDGYEIPARIWYYLLDWNEADEWSAIAMLYGKDKLKDLTKAQLLNLLYVASQQDIRNNQ